MACGLNQDAWGVFQQASAQASSLGIEEIVLPCGTHVLDLGVRVRGGLEAGLRLASICMAGHASIEIETGDREIWSGPWVNVRTDHPVAACMLSQYAGWPVKHDKFFAMGSGPMRIRRGREEILLELAAVESQSLAVGTLECDELPTCDVASSMAEACQVNASELWLAVAPTRSLAGCVQVVARSVETSLHKLHQLGFALASVTSAFGAAPLPPPTPNFAKGIGRTNDAILYGGQVTLWVDSDDDLIQKIGPQLPSCASRDFGAPFADIFKRYDYDFYKVDPALFSPAEITICNLKSGRSWKFGRPRADLIAQSFSTVNAV